MYAFSKISKQRLATCHVDLQTLMNEVIKWYDITIVCGHRGQEAQDKAYKEGKSQLRFPQSKHNRYPSDAVDITTYNKGIDWRVKPAIYLAGWVMGIATRLYEEGKITHKIRCGIDWNMDNDIMQGEFFDPGHFEIIE